MKKILIVTDYYQPHIGYSKVQVAKNLIEKGYNVKVLTSDRFFPFPNYKSTVQKILGERIRSVGMHVENGIPILRKKSVLEVFARDLFFGVREEVEKFRPDTVLVYTAASFSAIQVALAKRSFNFKLIFIDTLLPSEFERGNRFLKNIFYFAYRLFFSKKISDAGDKFIAAQEETTKIIKGVYGIKGKITLIDQGTDPKIFRYSLSERMKLRNKYRLKKKDFVMVYTGKIILAKGVDLLFEAFELLARKYNDVYLLVIGSGEGLFLEKCKFSLSASSKKRFIHVLFQPGNELYKYYSMADVGVWPLQESLSMNDAASCKIPFIANDHLGARTRIGNNNALLYKQGDVKDLATKIEYLYKNPQVFN